MLMRSARSPLEDADVPRPSPGSGQVLVRVRACGVCRTDLHVLDGELSDAKLPLILGHEIVGEIVGGPRGGERVGVPWLGWTDQTCRYCRGGHENLCDGARFTGYTLDGGYAEYTVADERFCLPVPAGYSDVQAAPLLCAGLIGYRTYRLAGPHAEHLGIYGFGAAAHIIAQVAVAEGRQVYAFTRPGDMATQEFARRLGAVWAGGSDARPPRALDAALIFAPVGALVVAALQAVGKGGVVVCGGIHMSDIPSFPYSLLWEERAVKSVANLTRADGAQFMHIAANVPLTISAQPFPLEQANEALQALRRGALEGAAVLTLAGD
jgi:alcohol dehydrogenase, propanol-preferring